MDPAQLAYQQALRRRQAHLHMAHLFSLFIRVIILNVAAIIRAQYLKQPWHTSILTGKMWVLELLGGHPEHIRTELGVHTHVSLMSFVLWAMAIQSLSLLRSNWPSSSIALSLA